jgi:deaminated glutathione amidase
MKVALIQMNSQGDKAANLAEARRLIERAVAEEAPRLVALPEVFTCMTLDPEARRRAAEPLGNGEAYRTLQELAAAHRVYLHGGSLIEQGGDRLYNTTVVFDPEGREIARYRKIHLFDVVTPDGKQYRESNSFGRGHDIVTFEAGGVTFGLTICYDLRFAELFLALAARGAKVILVPAAFTLQTGRDHWEVLLRARAIETQTYVLAPAQWGTYGDGRRANYGRSLIADPWGHVIAKAPDRVGYLAARLDFEAVDRVRAAIPVAQHRVL